jgi:hypothetical protein
VENEKEEEKRQKIDLKKSLDEHKRDLVFQTNHSNNLTERLDKVTTEEKSLANRVR